MDRSVFDTLDDLDVQEAPGCLQDLCDSVLKPLIPEGKQFAADITTGGVYLTESSKARTWGNGCNCGAEAFYVRSWPPGRINQPLVDDELRVLVVCRATQSTGVVRTAIIRVFLCNPTGANFDIQAKDVSRESYGVLGTPLFAVSVFDDITPPGALETPFIRSQLGNRLVMTSSATVYEENQSGARFVSPGLHEFTIAGLIAGVNVPDSARRCHESYTRSTWTRLQSQSMAILSEMITKRSAPKKGQPPALDQNIKSLKEAGAYYYASRRIGDNLSVVGTLDLMSADVCDGALPNELTHPLWIPLMLCVLTRIAAYPERFGLQKGTRNDVHSALEISMIFESSSGPVVESNGDVLRAIDIVANLALWQCRETIEEHTRNKRKSAANQMTQTLNESLEALFRMACTLVTDVCGTIQLSRFFGSSSTARIPPIEMARSDREIAFGLGRLHSVVPPLRISSRAERQRVILKMLGDVEIFLRTGLYCGRQQAAQNEPLLSEGPRFDADGFEKIGSYEDKCDVSLISALNISALSQAREQLVQLFSKGPIYFNTMSVNTYVVGSYTSVSCIDCGNAVHPMPSLAFETADGSLCPTCGNRRCWSCAMMKGAKACRICAAPIKRSSA